jgi:Asp-tRNA(Asn)/Glu-tRNA(Gln) amidotransferase A subunit family amidase
VIGPGDSIADIGRRLRARTLTSEALTEECLHRIEADDRRLHATRTESWLPGATVDLSTGYRSPSRI